MSDYTDPSSGVMGEAEDVGSVKPCRACSECDGDHHFSTAMMDSDDDGTPFYECKHCEMKAGMCEECDGPIFPITGQAVCAECTANRGDFEP